MHQAIPPVRACTPEPSAEQTQLICCIECTPTAIAAAAASLQLHAPLLLLLRFESRRRQVAALGGKAGDGGVVAGKQVLLELPVEGTNLRMEERPATKWLGRGQGRVRVWRQPEARRCESTAALFGSQVRGKAGRSTTSVLCRRPGERGGCRRCKEANQLRALQAPLQGRRRVLRAPCCPAPSCWRRWHGRWGSARGVRGPGMPGGAPQRCHPRTRSSGRG